MPRFSIFALYFAFLNIKFALSSPQIFESTQVCSVHITENKTVSVPRSAQKAENSQFKILFSLCNPLDRHILSANRGCQKNSAICILQKQKGNRALSVTGTFVLDESDDNTLRLNTVAVCKSNQGYSVKIRFDCSDFIKTVPKLNTDDDCTFEISVMRSDCSPPCTARFENHLIDLRPLRRKSISIKSEDNRQFYVTLCGADRNCGDKYSSCEINADGSISPLALVESQHVNYNLNKGELSVRGYFKREVSRKGRINFQIIMKCNWNTDIFNATFKKKQIQSSKKFDFEVESSFACIKYPPDCRVYNNFASYDLGQLYKPGGYQIPTTAGTLHVSVCGLLKSPSLASTPCNRMAAQVCEKSGNVYTSKGAIMTPMRFIKEGHIQTTFVDGSACNNSERFITVINFVCSNKDGNPKLEKVEGCTTHLIWESRKACPTYKAEGQKCLISDNFGQRDLRSLHTPEDKILIISKTSKIRYNLCESINSTCNGKSHVGACLIAKGKEKVLGRSTGDLLSKDGRLIMQMKGDKCSGSTFASLSVDFVCNLKHSVPPILKVIQDSCLYDLTIPTSKACYSDDLSNCTFSALGRFYDLTPLTLYDRNYEIPDVDNNKNKFYINICAPVINNVNIQCSTGSMVCLKRNEEIILHKRYISFGKVTSPSLIDGKLTLKGTMGTTCKGTEDYTAVIRFLCAERQSKPILIKKTECVYEFEFRTPHACPQIMDQKNCSLGGVQLSDELPTVSENYVNIHLTPNQSYKLGFCEDTYQKCNKTTDSCEKKKQTREFFKNGSGPMMRLHLDEKCSSSRQFNSVLFKFICGPNSIDFVYREENIEDCTLNIDVLSQGMCLVNNLKENEHSTPKVAENSRCDGNVTFNFKQLGTATLDTPRNLYVVNFDDSARECSGVLCKNGDLLVPALTTCTPIKTAQNGKNLTFSFKSNYCKNHGDFTLEVIVTDSAQPLLVPRILKDEECYLSVGYLNTQNQQLVSDEGKNHKVIGITVGVILTAIGLIILTVIFCRKYKSAYLRVSVLSYGTLNQRAKDQVPVYMKDAIV